MSALKVMSTCCPWQIRGMEGELVMSEGFTLSTVIGRKRGKRVPPVVGLYSTWIRLPLKPRISVNVRNVRPELSWSSSCNQLPSSSQSREPLDNRNW